MRKDALDLPGFAGLLLFTTVLAGNQIVMKLTSTGLSPVFQAGLRSLFACAIILIWMLVRGIGFGSLRRDLWPGLAMGVAFSLEFIGLFNALDMTTVARASIIFYTMPMHLSLAAHFLIPGERLTPVKIAGLICAFAGVVIVLLDRPGGEASLAGDLLAWLGAIGWATIALIVRITRISEAPPEAQQLWQLSFSAVALLAVAPLFGPLLRDFGTEHIWLMGYQVFLVASFGFLGWFYLMKTYPAAIVASFSFLTPVLAVFMGWAVLGEELHLSVLLALSFVSAGILLINRRAR
ncbi:DMT family transporter [Pseudooceanicola onchidii]|uniref:DMT family transporter n=1 Tax=Pseudooceanicola onchidii TaxID=2562279 RepID=UPI001F0D5D9C|nr:DMT family transporter [Pseudooceanicola onchidii]